MISLTTEEIALYNDKFLQKVPNLMPGVYRVRDLFESYPSVPRIARKFFEDVSAGRFDNIVLKGERSNEGYIVLEGTIENRDEKCMKTL